MSERVKFIVFVSGFAFVTASIRPAVSSISPLLETIRIELAMSNLTASFLSVIPILCMAIFAPFASRLGYRWGSEKIIAYCLILVGATLALRYVATSTALLMGTAILIGIGTAIASPLFSGFIKQHYPNNASVVTGFYTLGIGMGASAGTGLTIPILNRLNGSWNDALAIWFVLPILGLLVWWPYLRAQAGRRMQEELNVEFKGRMPWRNKRAWILTLFFGLQSCVHFAMATWLSPMAQSVGINEYQSGVVVTAYTFIQTIFSLIISILIRNSNNRRPWLASCILIMIAGLLPVAISSTAMTIWIAAVVLGIGSGGLFSMAFLLPLDETTTAQEASSWTAMIVSIGNIFGSLGPSYVGIFRDYFGDFQNAYIGLIVLCIVMLCVIMNIKRAEVRPETVG